MLTLHTSREKDGSAATVLLTFDEEGAYLLIDAIRRTIRRGTSDHDHLKTAAWGGSELDEGQSDEQFLALHHLLIDFTPVEPNAPDIET